jgi:hypothetical protein
MENYIQDYDNFDPREIAQKFGPQFLLFAKFIKSGKSPRLIRNFATIASDINRFGDYRKSILEILQEPVNHEDSERAEEIEAEHTAYQMLLEGFNQYCQKQFGQVFPEFMINQPGSAIHLQTLSESLLAIL